jgi:hypothetical protein
VALGMGAGYSCQRRHERGGEVLLRGRRS